MVEFALRISDRLTGGAHPKSAGLVMRGTDSVTVDVDILDVRRAASYSLGERDGCVFHLLPRRQIRIRRFEVNPSAGTSSSRIVLQGQVNPTLLCVSGLCGWVANHLANRTESDRNPCRILFGSD